MTRFAGTHESEGAAIAVVADEAAFAVQNGYTALTSDDPTLTAAQVVNGIVSLSGQTAAQGVTLPAAAGVAALLPNLQIGSSFDFVLRNLNTSSGEVTLTAGSGNTIVGTGTLAISKTQLFKGIVTAVDTPAITYHALLVAGV